VNHALELVPLQSSQVGARRYQMLRTPGANGDAGTNSNPCCSNEIQVVEG